jgi:hypothetical protein
MFIFFDTWIFFLIPCSLRLTHGLAQRLAHNRGRAVQIGTTETMAHAQFDFARFWRPICQSRHLKLQGLQMNLGVENPTSWQKTPKNRCGLNWAPAMQQCLIALVCVHSRTWRCTYWLKCTCAQASTLCARPCRVREWRRCPCLSKLRSGITSGTLPKMIDTCLVTKHSNGF